MQEIPTRFDHTQEPDLYAQAEKSGEFQPHGGGEPFSIIIPPPNVTGDLHLGHALTYSLQDTVARFARRHGRKVLVVPGADHAAIAVQALVEKKIQKEKGLSRTQLGKEKFLEEVRAWIDHYLPRMKDSLKRFGLSADWTRFRFTMDEHSQLAVRTAFVELYEKGLIYRGHYLVNWDPKLQTAVSDDEVLHEERAGKLYWIKYGPITVATTRPETKLGDTAIAVSPKDKRYEKYVGKEISFTNELGLPQKLPVIADELVDPEFGTGALKVTPAHDPTDWALGQKHKLPVKEVINQYGKMAEETGPYAGLRTEEAREKIIEDLSKQGLIEKITDHTIRVPISERSGAVIQPLPSTQWFLKTTALKEDALKAVKSGAIKFYPKSIEKTYFHWLDNLHDWCISRQLWWGHPIPAWYCQNKKGPASLVVTLDKPKTCPVCGKCPMEADPDVLDTWFSSGLWPFSTLGWPLKNSPDLKDFYPISFLETGADILFFWVARMIMLSQALTGKVPFKEVYFHGLVLDEQGQKMSKSKGNTMDPLHLIEKYGADALRMSLIGGTGPGQPQRFTEANIIKYRNFVTKIWNASRFVNMQIANQGGQSDSERTIGTKQPGKSLANDWSEAVSELRLPWLASTDLDPTEKKFMTDLEKLQKNNQKYLASYQLNLALEELYEFFWHRFADELLEYEKKVLAESTDPARQKQSKAVLASALNQQLELLGDFAPFVCQAIQETKF